MFDAILAPFRRRRFTRPAKDTPPGPRVGSPRIGKAGPVRLLTRMPSSRVQPTPKSPPVYRRIR